MNKEEVIELIRRNQNPKPEAIKLISDFLVVNKNEVTKIYEQEIENVFYK